MAEKKGLTFFNLPWQIFAIITAVVLIATYTGVLPAGMTGCFIFMIVVLICILYFTQRTRTGRYIYAVGGNETAARFSGINVEKIKILVWTFSGLLCAFAGVVLSAKLKSGQPSTSVGAETDAIASCVLGGTSMYGGTGRTSGMIIGVFIIGVISNGLTLMHLDVNWQYVVKGVIILVAVYADMVRQRKSQARKE